MSSVLKKVSMALMAMLLLVVPFLSLWGCNGGFASCSEDMTKVRIWAGSYWGGENKKLLDRMVDKYNEYARANGKREAIAYVKQNMDSLVATGSINGSISDIILWDRWSTIRYANQQLFEPLNARMAAAGHSFDEFNQEALSEFRIGNTYYGLPLDLDTWGIFVNINLYIDWAENRASNQDKSEWLENKNVVGTLDETTVGYPNSKYNFPKTWDQFYKAAHGLAIRNPNSAVGFERAGFNVDAQFSSWFTTAGGKLAKFGSDGKAQEFIIQSTSEVSEETGLTMRETAQRVLNFWDKLLMQRLDTDAQKNEAVTGFDFAQSIGNQDPFLVEKIAMTTNSLLNGVANYNYYKDDDFKFDFMPYPAMDSNTKQGGMMGGYGFVVADRANWKDDAWDLVKWWILDDDNYLEWSKISKLIPSRNSVMELVKQDDEIMEAAPYLARIMEVIDNYRVRPPVVAYTLYETTYLSPNLDKTLRRTVGIGNTAADYHNYFFEILEKYKDATGDGNNPG